MLRKQLRPSLLLPAPYCRDHRPLLVSTAWNYWLSLAAFNSRANGPQATRLITAVYAMSAKQRWAAGLTCFAISCDSTDLFERDVSR